MPDRKEVFFDSRAVWAKKHSRCDDMLIAQPSTQIAVWACVSGPKFQCWADVTIEEGQRWRELKRTLRWRCRAQRASMNYVTDSEDEEQ